MTPLRAFALITLASILTALLRTALNAPPPCPKGALCE